MLKNRLKVVRKALKKTQQEVAFHIGVIQSTYSYWESGKVKIDNESFCRLAEYFGVSMDFLQGRKYRMTWPVEKWDDDLKEDYKNANQFEREYLHYLYGKLTYVDNAQDMCDGDHVADPATDELYKKISLLDDEDKGKVDGFVSGLLATSKYRGEEQTYQIKIAARNGGGVKEITLTESQMAAILNAPEVTELRSDKS